MLKSSMQPAMSAEGYRIRRLDQDTELISAPNSSSVEPFPIRSWNEPLPIAVEGRPLPKSQVDKSETKSLARFYPPLLFLSTTLTGIFLFLYVTKPVIVEGVSEEGLVASKIVQQVSPQESVVEAVAQEELSPFPDAGMLTTQALPGFEAQQAEVISEPVLRQTVLSAEQIVEVESLSNELEKVSVSLSVFYPENLLSWNEESIFEAQILARDIELHLEKVREVQANGIDLLENWNRIISNSSPTSVLENKEVLGKIE